MTITHDDTENVSTDTPAPSKYAGFPEKAILAELKPLRARQKAYCDAEHFFASYIENLFRAAEILISEKPFASA